MQLRVETLSNAGALHNMTVTAPGTQGAGVAGTHGIGVGTPSAAAVAAATIGLEGDWHIPKGGIFMMGTWSMILAAIILLVITVLGVGIKVLGAMPNVHFIMAPIQVCIGICWPSSFRDTLTRGCCHPYCKCSVIVVAGHALCKPAYQTVNLTQPLPWRLSPLQ